MAAQTGHFRLKTTNQHVFGRGMAKDGRVGILLQSWFYQFKIKGKTRRDPLMSIIIDRWITLWSVAMVMTRSPKQSSSCLQSMPVLLLLNNEQAGQLYIHRWWHTFQMKDNDPFFSHELEEVCSLRQEPTKLGIRAWRSQTKGGAQKTARIWFFYLDHCNRWRQPAVSRWNFKATKDARSPFGDVDETEQPFQKKGYRSTAGPNTSAILAGVMTVLDGHSWRLGADLSWGRKTTQTEGDGHPGKTAGLLILKSQDLTAWTGLGAGIAESGGFLCESRTSNRRRSGDQLANRFGSQPANQHAERQYNLSNNRQQPDIDNVIGKNWHGSPPAGKSCRQISMQADNRSALRIYPKYYNQRKMPLLIHCIIIGKDIKKQAKHFPWQPWFFLMQFYYHKIKQSDRRCLSER